MAAVLFLYVPAMIPAAAARSGAVRTEAVAARARALAFVVRHGGGGVSAVLQPGIPIHAQGLSAPAARLPTARQRCPDPIAAAAFSDCGPQLVVVVCRRSFSSAVLSRALSEVTCGRRRSAPPRRCSRLGICSSPSSRRRWRCFPGCRASCACRYRPILAGTLFHASCNLLI